MQDNSHEVLDPEKTGSSTSVCALRCLHGCNIKVIDSIKENFPACAVLCHALHLFTLLQQCCEIDCLPGSTLLVADPRAVGPAKSS